MKRKAVWLVVPVVLAVALGAAKYRLDHPPLSRADKLFRQMADRADEIVIVYTGVFVATDDSVSPVRNPVLGRLKGAQIQELAERVRLMDAPCFAAASGGWYGLRFYRQKQLLGGANVLPSRRQARLQLANDMPSPFDSESGAKARYVHPRFTSRLGAYLMKVAPDPYSRGRKLW